MSKLCRDSVGLHLEPNPTICATRHRRFATIDLTLGRPAEVVGVFRTLIALPSATATFPS